MSDVQFDDDTNFERRKFAMQAGEGPDAMPHISSENKLFLSVVFAFMIGATLFIWLKYVNSHAPRVINDSSLTPYSGTSL